MDALIKKWIGSASLLELMEAWRKSKNTDPIMQGENGRYFARIMRIRQNHKPIEFANASRQIGWK